MSRHTVAAVGIGFSLMLFGVTASIGVIAQSAMSQPVQKVDDGALKDRIEYRLETSDVTHKYDISVKVKMAAVTLTGDVATAGQKAEAGKLAKVAGVSVVDNEIKVTPDADKTLAERAKNGLSKTGEAITDAWITTKVHWFLMGDDLLKGSDINVDTHDHVVTLKGTVKSAAGKARAEALAKRPDGVKSVVNDLKIG